MKLPIKEVRSAEQASVPAWIGGFAPSDWLGVLGEVPRERCLGSAHIEELYCRWA